MSVIFIILPLAIVMAGVALAAFLWAVRGGQFDDLETPAYRAAVDDDDGAVDAVRDGHPNRGGGTSAA